MTTVRVRFTPNNVPTPGRIRFQARHDKDTRPIVSGRDILNANADYIPVPVEGAEIAVRPQDAGWHYVVRAQADGGPMVSGTFLVPANGPVDFQDLVRYDPKAGMAYEPDPDWWAHLKGIENGIDGVQADLHAARDTATKASSAATASAQTAVDSASAAELAAQLAVESSENFAGRDLLDASSDRVMQPTEDEDIAFAVTDDSGNASVLAVKHDGSFADHAVAAIEGIGSVKTDSRLALNDESFVIADADDNLSDFALAADGSFSPRTIAALSAAINVDAMPSDVTGLTAIGDSITNGGDAGIKWSQVLSDELGLDHWNPSVSGESSADIATRSGALRPLVTLAGDAIPSGTTGVDVTAIIPTDGWRALSGGGTQIIGDFDGVLQGVAGKLKRNPDGSGWTFTRAASGQTIPVPPVSPFATQGGKARRSDLWVMWPGRNNPNWAQVSRELATMVGFLAGARRFLVLSILNNAGETLGSGGHTNIVNLNASMAAAYPDSYVDIRSWLISDGLAAVGLTPTANDETDIANDLVPRALRADTVHPNKYGALAIAARLKQIIQEKGWATR